MPPKALPKMHLDMILKGDHQNPCISHSYERKSSGNDCGVRLEASVNLMLQVEIEAGN